MILEAALLGFTVVLLFALYWYDGWGEDGHLLSISMVACKERPLGCFALCSLNVIFFLILYVEYYFVAWASWVLLTGVISYHTDRHEQLHTALFWLLSVLYIGAVPYIASQHQLWVYVVPFFATIGIYALFILYSLAFRGVITYAEQHKGDEFLHGLQSLLEILFVASVCVFLVSYHVVVAGL